MVNGHVCDSRCAYCGKWFDREFVNEHVFGGEAGGCVDLWRLSPCRMINRVEREC